MAPRKKTLATVSINSIKYAKKEDLSKVFERGHCSRRTVFRIRKAGKNNVLTPDERKAKILYCLREAMRQLLKQSPSKHGKSVTVNQLKQRYIETYKQKKFGLSAHKKIPCANILKTVRKEFISENGRVRRMIKRPPSYKFVVKENVPLVKLFGKREIIPKCLRD